jgi:hypothetical protein
MPRRTLGVIWHKDHYHSPLAEHYLAALRQWAAGCKWRRIDHDIRLLGDVEAVGRC